MPHLTFEYSANLEGRIDLPALCEVARVAALSSGVFREGALKVRALRADAYAVGDNLPENAFVDLTLRMEAGRSRELRMKLGEKIFAAVSHFCAPLFETPHFALTFEVREIEPALSWKKNVMHQRLYDRQSTDA
jgi:5-carboxymethyl-2-hydroxymuconate isomerase